MSTKADVQKIIREHLLKQLGHRLFPGEAVANSTGEWHVPLFCPIDSQRRGGEKTIKVGNAVVNPDLTIKQMPTSEEISLALKAPVGPPGWQKGVTIFGQIVLDHIVHVRHVFESGDLSRFMEWDSAGNILIHDKAAVSTPYVETATGQARRLVFQVNGDLRSASSNGGFQAKAGLKITGMVNMADIDKEGQTIGTDNERITRFGYPRQVPGGGGTNVGYALYNVFRNIPVTYVSVYSEASMQDNVIVKALGPVFARGELKLQPVDPIPAVNLVIEGIGNDRLIIRSPRSALQMVEYYHAKTDVVMVNSSYNIYSAMNGLIEAIKPGRYAVIACTQALCNSTPIPDAGLNELREWVARELGMTVTKMTTVDEFIKTFIMPYSDAVTYIFNEEELNSFVKSERIPVLDLRFKRPLFDGILNALMGLRRLQAGKKPEIIITLGELGALYLGTDNGLHYCRASKPEEVKRVPRERNAIGDLFAAFIVAILSGRRARKPNQIFRSEKEDSPLTEDDIPVQSDIPGVLIAACAGAEAGVYDGFLEVEPGVVNSIIHTKTRQGHYAYLGRLGGGHLDPLKFAGAEAGWVFDTLLQEKLRRGTVKDAVILEELVESRLLSLK